MAWIRSLICTSELWSDGLFHLRSEHVSVSLRSWLGGFLDPTGVRVSGILCTLHPRTRGPCCLGTLEKNVCKRISGPLTVFVCLRAFVPAEQRLSSDSISRAPPYGLLFQNFFKKLVNLFQLEDDDFTILWWFLPYVPMNQPRVTMCPPSRNPPTSLPTPSLWVVPEHRL